MLAEALADVREHLFLYLSMPLTSGLVGWATNVLAIEMMFRPIEFRGWPPFLGWQGIVPSKAGKMAGIAVDTMTEKLIRPKDIFDRLEPARVAAELEGPLVALADRITEEVMVEHQPTLWRSLPEAARRRVLDRVRAEAPETVTTVMAAVRDDVERVFDLKDMVVTQLVRDKALLNRIFVETGRAELRFIGRSGFTFGFAFGVVQMILWVFVKSQWQLPAFGLVVGWATNWIALWMIFQPKEPTTIGPWTFHGLFLARKDEVARDYGDLIADQILTPANILEAILKGPYADRLFHMISKQVERTIDEQASGVVTTPFVAFAIGTRRYEEMKASAVEHLLSHLPDTLQHVTQYAEGAMDVRRTLVTKMQALSPEAFEGMLRPAFEEDEWILIAVGAALGFLVGLGQLALFLAAGQVV